MTATHSTKRILKQLPVGLIILLALFSGALFLFIFIIDEVLREKEELLDNNVFNFLSAHVISPHLTSFMKGVTYFASANFLQVAYVVLILFHLFIKKYKTAIEVAVLGLSGFLVNYFMKLSFHRLRPPHPLIAPLDNFSFPSGHATSGFIFYGLLTYLVWKTNISRLLKYITGTIFILFSLLIGFSRIYLRVHYPSDVAAGFCVGFAWLILTIWLFERFERKPASSLKQKFKNG
ncbi:MAG: phosphatase PAP2 family protein [Ginsengibacter sp.]